MQCLAVVCCCLVQRGGTTRSNWACAGSETAHAPRVRTSRAPQGTSNGGRTFGIGCVATQVQHTTPALWIYPCMPCLLAVTSPQRVDALCLLQQLLHAGRQPFANASHISIHACVRVRVGNAFTRQRQCSSGSGSAWQQQQAAAPGSPTSSTGGARHGSGSPRSRRGRQRPAVPIPTPRKGALWRTRSAAPSGGAPGVASAQPVPHEVTPNTVSPLARRPFANRGPPESHWHVSA